MTTKEFIKCLESDVKKLEIREMVEDDPSKAATIRKRKNKRMKLLKEVRAAFDRKYITADGKTMEYETATMERR